MARRKRGKCKAVRISRGKMRGRYRNPCTGRLVKSRGRK